MKKTAKILCAVLSVVLLLGVCHPHMDPYNRSLLQEANIGWIRIDIP